MPIIWYHCLVSYNCARTVLLCTRWLLCCACALLHVLISLSAVVQFARVLFYYLHWLLFCACALLHVLYHNAIIIVWCRTIFAHLNYTFRLAVLLRVRPSVWSGIVNYHRLVSGPSTSICTTVRPPSILQSCKFPVRHLFLSDRES